MLLYWWVRVRNWLHSERGQALSEYGIIIGLVALAAITVLTAFSDELKGMFNRLSESISEVASEQQQPQN